MTQIAIPALAAVVATPALGAWSEATAAALPAEPPAVVPAAARKPIAEMSEAEQRAEFMNFIDTASPGTLREFARRCRANLDLTESPALRRALDGLDRDAERFAAERHLARRI